MRNSHIAILIIILIVVLAAFGLVLYFGGITSVTECNYDSNNKSYVGKSKDECSRIQFLCAPNTKQFEDECGCGCEEIEGNNVGERNYCPPEGREAGACIQLYQPVCGWFGKEIQCIKYPCANTYGNSCFACMDENVEYWTEGECAT